MKIGIVGTGLVGATAGYALVMENLASELVLVDKDAARAEGEAMDISHVTPFSHPARVLAGDYATLAGAAIVIVAAGANQKPGETRLELINKNAAIFRQVIPQIIKAAPEAILLIATNPVDALTQVAYQVSGLPKERVIGSGTTLDTARLRALVATKAQVSPHNVHGYVLGEHGDSEIVAWSSFNIAGLALHDYFAQRQMPWSEAIEAEIQQDVRRAAYDIIQRKGATYYGVATALARIVEAILQDQRSVLTISMSDGELAYSLPRVLGREGVIETLEVDLDDGEKSALATSVDIIREALSQLAD